MSAAPTLDQSYARTVPQLSMRWGARDFAQPALLVLNDALAMELGLDPEWLRSPAGVGWLTGSVAEDTPTYAQVYAGHQFGGYSPRLGDGRALLLGELLDGQGRRWDLHLKGSGRTPFARGGDGLAAVGPMLREYLISEAMHALGIPTTRALAVCSTGEQVHREEALPGAVLVRVAASHLRVGTFQYAAALGQPDLLAGLADYAISRHDDDLAGSPTRYLDFYTRVVRRQARLVASWMLVGFVHGVMNTDNMTISGETIDYGPCAFMDRFDPATVFSSIDTGGRYAYANQPTVAQWNLARLAEALLPLLARDEESTDAAVAALTERLSGFAGEYTAAFEQGLAGKLGTTSLTPELASGLFSLLHQDRVDFTMFFRSLADGSEGTLIPDSEPLRQWRSQRDVLLLGAPAQVRAEMDRVNPVYIPRNHLVEAALTAATHGDLAPFHRLVDVVRQPFTERSGLAEYALPAPSEAERYVTYCGT
ncbi:MAG: protein adenylyltransferase SelO [Actinomycetales bacterium]